MGVADQRHSPAALPPGKTRCPLYRRLSGPQGRSGRVRKISPPTGIRSPDRPARSESLYRLSYLGPPVIPSTFRIRRTFCTFVWIFLKQKKYEYNNLSFFSVGLKLYTIQLVPFRTVLLYTYSTCSCETRHQSTHTHTHTHTRARAHTQKLFDTITSLLSGLLKRVNIPFSGHNCI
jgi:hypothetical protein